MLPVLLLLLSLTLPTHQINKPQVSLTPTPVTSSSVSSTSAPAHFAASTSYFEVTTVEYEGLELENLAYLGSITLGGSSSSFPVTFDSTIALTWIFSDDCDSCQQVVSEDSELFKCVSPCKASADARETEVSYSVNGLVQGNQFNVTAYKASDSVTLGALTATSVPLYIVEKTTANNFKGVGSVGLGNSESNILRYYYNQGKIQNQLFAFYFSSQLSVLTYGYEEAYFGMEDYEDYDVASDNVAWGIKLAAVEADGQVNSSLLSSTKLAQFDSTLSGLGVPANVHSNIVSLIESALGNTSSYSSESGISVYCANHTQLSDLPKLGFQFGTSDKVFSLKGKEYAKYKNETCYIQIFKDDSLSNWVLGIPFLKTYYIIFDMDDQIVKIATKNTEAAESFTQSEGLRIGVIVTGVLVAILAVVLLLLIFKPVPVGSMPNPEEKGE